MKIRVAFLLIILTVFALIEAGFWLLDSHMGFSRTVAHQLRNTDEEDYYLRSDPIFPGLATNEIPIRTPDSKNSRGLFRRTGDLEVNEFHPFASQKIVTPFQDQKKRIYVIGESAGFGYPYPYDQSFSFLLQNQLNNKNIEVVNASQPGIISVEALAISDKILNHFNPQTMIFFLGNNIWISWRPSLFSFEAESLKWLRILSMSRTLAWVEYMFLRRAQPQILLGDTQHSHDLEQALKNPLISPKLDWEKVRNDHLENFKERLIKQIQKAKMNNTRVILTSMPFNYRVSPAWNHPQIFSFDPKKVEFVQKDLLSAYHLLQNRKKNQALALIENIIRQEPRTPFPYYLKGLALEKKNEQAEAEKAYSLARNFTVGNLGGIPDLNKIIEETAKNMNVDFIDLKKIFDADSHARGLYYNQDLIGDQCHPTPRGHALISKSLAKAITREHTL